jgi:hypothetical protein
VSDLLLGEIPDLGQKTIGSARWLSAGVWAFIAALLVIFGASVVGQLLR